MSAAQREEFIDKVRSAYLEVFGEDPFDGTDDGNPAALGTVLVLFESQYLDGGTGIITLYEGSYNACKGMAWRFLDNDYRSDE